MTYVKFEERLNWRGIGDSPLAPGDAAYHLHPGPCHYQHCSLPRERDAAPARVPAPATRTRILATALSHTTLNKTLASKPLLHVNHDPGSRTLHSILPLSLLSGGK